MTPADVATFAVPLLTAVILGTYAWYYTAHNTAVERIRWIGARPMGAIPPEDQALRLRYAALRQAADRRAVA